MTRTNADRAHLARYLSNREPNDPNNLHAIQLGEHTEPVVGRKERKMTTPIKPSDATVDRECEQRWIEQINTKLAEPWGGNEVRRIIEVEGKMSSQSQLVRWVQDQYIQAGWHVSAESAINAPDKYAALTFTRPYEGASQ